MRRFNSFLTAGLGLALLVGLAAFGQDATSQDATPDTARLGEKVPNFTLVDLEGNSHSLADFEGKTVILEWYSPRCPYSRGVYENGVVERTLERLESLGADDYVYFAVNSSSDIDKDEVIDNSGDFLEGVDVEIPVLIDYSGEVGQMFDAKTTPHLFVIDGDGILRYDGAYTNDGRFNKPEDDVVNYVIGALDQLEAGETVAPDQTRPWGCTVKYTD